MLFPGEVRQVGHVVADLDQAMHEWVSMGVGPWTVIDVVQAATYRGDLDTTKVSIGFAHAGSLQIELIEACGEGRSPWHEARDAGRFGPHHLAYWTDEFDEVVERLGQLGLAVVAAGDGNGLTRFVYVEGPAHSTLIEIMELTEISRTFMDAIRDASLNWDGSGQPIRR